MSGTSSLDVLEDRTLQLGPGPTGTRRHPRVLPILLLLTLLLGPACGTGSGTAGPEVFTIGAIPDQDPEVLQRLYGTLAGHLSEVLGVPVEYRPVTDYAASVNLFRAGDLDMVWFGGLTGVQARLQVDGARAILQRSIDESFQSVFIASTSSGLAPVDDVAGLAQLSGRRFTFGSETSTSGRLMPEYFLAQAGVGTDRFAGPPGFSGSHDATIELVESGSFEAGVVNEQVWAARTGDGQVDPDRVISIFRTPPYHDYHWLIHPDVGERFGDGFVERVQAAFLELDPAHPVGGRILELFGAEEFIESENANYARIEEVARELGLIPR